MANTKSNNKKSTNKTGNTKKTTSKSTRQQIQTNTSTSFADHFHAFSKTKVFKFLLYIIAFVAIIGLDLLISWNNFDTFFLILGIEIIAAAIFYIINLLVNKNKSSDTNNTNERS